MYADSLQAACGLLGKEAMRCRIKVRLGQSRNRIRFAGDAEMRGNWALAAVGGDGLGKTSVLLINGGQGFGST